MSQQELTTYLKLCTEYYDLEHHRYDAQAQNFYSSYAQKINGLTLEPMCGTGRFLLPLLETGLAIEGFDASPYMLAALREKYAKLSSNPAPVWQQFLQDFI